MKDRSSMFVPLTLMMLLVGITYWISHIMEGSVASGPLRHDPDYIISHFNIRKFDINGMLQHTLIAEKMTHYPDDDTTLVTSPHLISHRSPQTDIFAQQALVSKDSKEIDFINDVRVVRQAINAQALPTLMETRLLKVLALMREDPTFRAQTNEATGDLVISGMGERGVGWWSHSTHIRGLGVSEEANTTYGVIR